MITNTAHPYHCPECAAPLGKLLMQHFPRRTLVLGACDTASCPNCDSHQAAEVINADERTLEALRAISDQHSISIGEMPYPLAIREGV